MEDPFVELVALARRALTAPRKIKPAAVHLLEAHPRCVPELANLVRAGNFTETSRWLQARRPAHVDRDVVLQIERALNDRLRGDRPRRSGPADAPAPPWGGRAAARPAVRSRISGPIAAAPREAGRTVVAVGGMVDALIPFHRDVDDVQRWVAPPGRLTLVRPLPDMVRGTDETQQWRQEVRDGTWVCPWPACPHPELGAPRRRRAGPPRRAHLDPRARR